MAYDSKKGKGSKVHAPYNFVPLFSDNLMPEGLIDNFMPEGLHNKTSIDVPLENGVSGEIAIRLNTHSPLMIGMESGSNSIVKFFNVNGEPRIPGSSIRGMLRNVSEIVTISKFQNVNNRFPTLRNIRDDDYKSKLNDEQNKLAVKAGWLTYDNEDKCYHVRRCEYAKVDYSLIKKWTKRNDLYREKNIERKYKKASYLKQIVNFQVNQKNTRGEWKATQGNEYQGRLVFTGVGFKKKTEYVFFEEEHTTFPVSDSVMQAFLSIYNKGNKEDTPLNTLKRIVKLSGPNVPGIPIFYREIANQNIAFLGLTAMMKIPPNYNVHDLLPDYSTPNESNIYIDMTENLFGRTEDDSLEESYSLKSRLSFSDLKITKGELASQPINVVLSEPKSSFYPSYLKQGNNQIETQLPSKLESYHSDQKPSLRGFKRYPVQTNVPLQPSMSHLDSNKQNENISTKILPLTEGAKFIGKVRFHNVAPKELGLLCWLLTWGNESDLHHSLGMAKPYGYGNVSISVESLELEKNNEPGNWHDATNQLSEYIRIFEKRMQTTTRNRWKDSDRMTELKAMARGIDAKSSIVKYMNLNEHTKAKANDGKSKKSNGYALASFTHLTK